MKTLGRIPGLLLAAQLAACSFMKPSTPVHADAAEARSTAAEALLYGTPIVRSYGILYAHAGDPKNPEFQAPWNTLRHRARLAEPEDPAPRTPSLDTVTSWLGLDLRAEPLVLTLPAMEKKRTYWAQLTDLLKTTPAWMASRTTGSDGGVFLLARSGWSGEKPPGVKAIVRIETDLALAIFKIQVFGPEDLETVQALQSGITLQRLSAFLKQAAPPPLPMASLVEPLAADEPPRSMRFFDVLACALQFCPSPQSERKLRTRFGRIGLLPGKPFDPQAFSPELREALEEGMADAWKTYQTQKKLAEAKEIHRRFCGRARLAPEPLHGSIRRLPRRSAGAVERGGGLAPGTV